MMHTCSPEGKLTSGASMSGHSFFILFIFWRRSSEALHAGRARGGKAKSTKSATSSCETRRLQGCLCRRFRWLFIQDSLQVVQGIFLGLAQLLCRELGDLRLALSMTDFWLPPGHLPPCIPERQPSVVSSSFCDLSTKPSERLAAALACNQQPQ